MPSLMYMREHAPMFDLEGTGVEGIYLDDICRTLYGQKRFLGRTSRPYSVLEHSIFVNEILKLEYPERLAAQPELSLGALLHDATEAYTGDMPTPVKRLIGPQYGRLERRLARRVYRALDVPPWVVGSTLVKTCDEMAALLEIQAFLPGLSLTSTQRERYEACSPELQYFFREFITFRPRAPEDGYETLYDFFMKEMIAARAK